MGFLILFNIIVNPSVVTVYAFKFESVTYHPETLHYTGSFVALANNGILHPILPPKPYGNFNGNSTIIVAVSFISNDGFNVNSYVAYTPSVVG